MQSVTMARLSAQQCMSFELKRNAHRQLGSRHLAALIDRAVQALHQHPPAARKKRPHRAVEGAARNLAIALVPRVEQHRLLVDVPATANLDGAACLIDRLHSFSRFWWRSP